MSLYLYINVAMNRYLSLCIVLWLWVCERCLMKTMCNSSPREMHITQKARRKWAQQYLVQASRKRKWYFYSKSSALINFHIKILIWILRFTKLTLLFTNPSTTLTVNKLLPRDYLHRRDKIKYWPCDICTLHKSNTFAYYRPKGHGEGELSRFEWTPRMRTGPATPRQPPVYHPVDK